MNLKTLAEKYHMNPTYISNKFKEYFGISPIFLQRNMLFEKAKDYLLSSAMNINEISEELGFSEHAVFTRFFHGKGRNLPKGVQKYRVLNLSYWVYFVSSFRYSRNWLGVNPMALRNWLQKAAASRNPQE